MGIRIVKKKISQESLEILKTPPQSASGGEQAGKITFI